MRFRRELSTSVVVVLLLTSAAFAQQSKVAAPNPALPALWNELVAGNENFQKDSIGFADLVRLRADLKQGQHPPVTVLSCSDSRVPPELVFRKNLGQLFIIRAAGNVADTFGIASIEYGILHKYTKLLVILAHEDCGAVEAAIVNQQPPDTPSLGALVARIRESFKPLPWCSINQPGCWQRSAAANALNTVNDLRMRSPTIRKAIDNDRLPVVVAYYNLVKGDLVVLSRRN